MAGPLAHRMRLVARLRSHGTLRSPAVIDAFRTVPREHFAPDGTSIGTAYDDRALVLTSDESGRATSTISQPSMVALMLEQLAVRPGDRVLEIGTASGYNAALLAHLTGPTGSVCTVELDPDLADRARDRLADLPQVSVLTGDGWAGAPECAPFDRIVVTVGVEDLSPAWTDQLAADGTMVVPLTLIPGLELSLELVRSGPDLRSATVQPCGFVRLRGPHAGGPSRIHTAAGWVITRDPPDPPTAQLVRDVLECPPRDCGAAPHPPPGWPTWLLLEDEHAVVITDAEPGPSPRSRYGLRDPGRGGVAYVRGGRIACHGDTRAADLLRSRLSHAESVDPHDLRVRVRPAGVTTPPGRWLISRPGHRFAVDVAPSYHGPAR